MKWILTRAVLMLLVVLAGCAGIDRQRAADPCCADPERYPPGLIAALDPLAPVVGRIVALVRWGPGRLAYHPEAQQTVLAELRPLDILLVSNKQRLSSRTIPGLFGHGVVYLGTERQLRDAGLWSGISERHRKAIAGGEIFLEADYRGVHLSRSRAVLDTDRVLVLRPVLDGRRRRGQALFAFLDSIGTPFDFRFDADTPDCVFCIELIERTLPELGFKRHRVYGRRLILPDEVARVALDGHPRLKPRLYVVGERNGWSKVPVRSARADINSEWLRQPPRTPADVPTGP